MASPARPGSGIRHPLFILFFVVLAVAIGGLATVIPAHLAFLLGFDIAAAAFLAAAFVQLGRASADRLRTAAARNDAGRGVLLVTAAFILGAVITGLTLELREAPKIPGEILIVTATLLLAWLFGNAVFAIHYAHMFYDVDAGSGDRGGINVPGTETPDIWDFVYFAFVLGMTFQVSDVTISRSSIRRVAIFHGAIAFLFNIGVVALSVNAIATDLARQASG